VIGACVEASARVKSRSGDGLGTRGEIRLEVRLLT
jgi:hypothetical protein